MRIAICVTEVHYSLAATERFNICAGWARASVEQKRLKIGFISGERGIGKSSIADIVRILLDRDDTIAGCHTLLGGVNTLDEMMKKILNELVNESIKTPWHQTILEFVGNKIKKVGAFGLSFDLNFRDDELASITEHFVANMTGLLDALNRHAKGLLANFGRHQRPCLVHAIRPLVKEHSGQIRPC